MRQASYSIAIVVIALFIGPLNALAKLSLTFGGSVGVFTLPKETEGYIDGNGFVSTTNRYMWSEVGTDQYGYTESTYKYKHPFPSKTLPNAGMNFGLTYTFQSRIGVFLEGCWASSIRDATINQSVPDSLAGDEFSMIPHDYRIRIIESNDRLYMKSFQFGLGLSYAMPLTNKTSLILAASVGQADYSQYFRIETKSVTTNYYQNSGHLVYTQTNAQGTFDVFGIRYSAFCVKPAIAAEWDVKSPLSVRIGLAYPISLVEKGAYITENYDTYSITYYPLNRFEAGNVVLDVGVSLGFGKGGN